MSFPKEELWILYWDLLLAVGLQVVICHPVQLREKMWTRNQSAMRVKFEGVEW